jgi:hypothetical protein
MAFSQSSRFTSWDVIFMLGVDYPTKYPWVERCLKAYFKNNAHAGQKTVRLTCFGDAVAGLPSFSSFTVDSPDMYTSHRGDDGREYHGVHLNTPYWFESCFDTLRGTSSDCNSGVVLNAISADLHWLKGQPASSVHHTAAQRSQIRSEMPGHELTANKINKLVAAATDGAVRAKQVQKRASIAIRQEPLCCLPCGTQVQRPKKEAKTIMEKQVRSSGEVCICFLFLAHRLGDSKMEALAQDIKPLLQQVRRKITFVPLLCDPQDGRLYSQALLLARLSGGFVVSPTQELDDFPFLLLQVLFSRRGLDSFNHVELAQRAQETQRALIDAHKLFQQGLHMTADFRALQQRADESRQEQEQAEQQQKHADALLKQASDYLNPRARTSTSHSHEVDTQAVLVAFADRVLKSCDQVLLPGQPFCDHSDLLVCDGDGAAVLVDSQPLSESVETLASDEISLLKARLVEMDDSIRRQAHEIEQLRADVAEALSKKAATRGKRGGRRTKKSSDAHPQDEDESSDDQGTTQGHTSIPDTASILSR